jgi:hypothetical protein
VTPSERIRHIRAIASALAQEDVSLIDLTLRQFQLPWMEDWRGSDKMAYVIDMIGDAPDGALLALAKHLGTASELEVTSDPAFWSRDDARVFVSHVSTIKAKAAQLREELAAYGIKAFVAHDDIEPTAEWQSEIEAALSTMDALIALLSQGFNDSRWCDQEVGVAVGRRVPIVPVKIELDPYGLFGKYQAIPAKGKSVTEVADLVFNALIAKPQIGPRITSKLVSLLVASTSWSQSRRLVTLIDKSVFVTPDHVRTMKIARETNAEVRDAWTVADKIDQLTAKHGS